jgi:hypothetical protein
MCWRFKLATNAEIAILLLFLACRFRKLNAYRTQNLLCVSWLSSYCAHVGLCHHILEQVSPPFSYLRNLHFFPSAIIFSISSHLQ